MLARVTAAAYLALCCVAAHAQMVAIGSSTQASVRNGVLSEWSEWETAMTGSCEEDFTPGDFDGIQDAEQTRYKTALQYPTASGTWPEEPGYTLPDDLEDGKLWDEPQNVEVPCDYVAPPPEEEDLPPPNPTYYTSVRVRTQSFAPTASDTGAFRLLCQQSHFAYDDPIVYPSQPGVSHLHNFFGNRTTNAFSTTANLRDGTDEGTCHGGTANLSAYWIPAMFDEYDELVVPDTILVYYKNSYNTTQVPGLRATVIWPPSGLRMIAGTASRSAPNQFSWEHQTYSYLCAGEGPRGPSILQCPDTQALWLKLDFPECWDGVNLDSPDHKSHMMVAPTHAPCPASHPVQIPQVSLNVTWLIPDGYNTSLWHVASDTQGNYATNPATPGGYSTHADVWFMWDEVTTVTGGLTIPQTILTQCLHFPRDCAADLLGNGQELY